MTKATIKRAPSKLACNWPSVSGLAEGREFGHSFRSVNNNYRVQSHRLCEIGCKVTKLSANNLLSPRKINKSLRKRAGKAVSSFCGRCKEFLFQPLTHWQVVEAIGSVGHEDGHHLIVDAVTFYGGIVVRKVSLHSYP